MATFTVTTAADSGAGSLRQAILDANAAGGADTIVFAPGMAGQTIRLASELPQIAGDLTIDGSAAAGLTIDGADTYRVFWASSGDIVVQSLTIANGRAEGGDGGSGWQAGGGGAGLGGGLFVDSGANVTLSDVTFTDNAAAGGRGGLGGLYPGGSGGGGGGGMGSGANGGDGGQAFGAGAAGGAGGGVNGGAAGSPGDFGRPGGDFSGGGGGTVPQYGFIGDGGDGGFGGGGGGAGRGATQEGPAGDGGFGGGSGGGTGGWTGVPASPGYGGGSGDAAGGGGGAGLGGAIFVREGGGLNLHKVSFSGSSVAAGGSPSTAAAAQGRAEGANLFLMGGGPLTISVSMAQLEWTIAGGIESDGSIELTKTGVGKLVLESGAYDLSSIIVDESALVVNAATELADTPATVLQGGALHGSGAIGFVDVQAHGSLLPGDGVGVLTVAGLKMAASSTLAVQIQGTAVGQQDQLNVVGSVQLGGASLTVFITPTPLGSFLLIKNDGVDAVSGTFNGFADDVAVTIGGFNYTVDYNGGDGNDVVLTIAAPNTAPSGTSSTLAVGYGAARTLAAADFGFTDADGDALAAVRITTLPTSGTLTLAGVAVSAGQSVTAAQLAAGQLVYTPSGSGTASFTFQVQDDGGTAGGGVDLDASPNTLTFNVGAAPPPPPPPAAVPEAGGDGADFAILNDSGTRYAAGDGADLVMAEGGDDTVHGNRGDDTLHGGPGNDIVHGGQGGDVLYGEDGVDVLFGDKGDDILHGGRGDDVIDGGDGSDALAGGQGNDVLRGGEGADFLSGDRGDDTLSGGPGPDLFFFTRGGGHDVVLDFNAAEGDRLQVVGAYQVSQVGADVLVDLGQGDTITLQNVQLSSLPNGWIL